MGWAFGRMTRQRAKRDAGFLVRSFPSVYIRVLRQEQRWVHGEQVDNWLPVYAGDALVRPAAGTVETYGLGTVENFDLQVLLTGDYGVRQGDVVRVTSSARSEQGRDYEVLFPPRWWDAFSILTLKQRSQMTGTTAT